MAQYKTYSTLVPNNNNVIYPEVLSINSVEDRNNIILNNQVVVIYYHAKWCGPCKNFSNEFNALAKKFERAGLIFVKEDVDLDLKNTPADPKVIPTFHFYKNGIFQTDKILSGVDVEKIINYVNNLL